MSRSPANPKLQHGNPAIDFCESKSRDDTCQMAVCSTQVEPLGHGKGFQSLSTENSESGIGMMSPLNLPCCLSAPQTKQTG